MVQISRLANVSKYIDFAVVYDNITHLQHTWPAAIYILTVVCELVSYKINSGMLTTVETDKL